MHRHRDLAVRRLAQGPAVLPGDADGVRSLLGKARAVEEVEGLREQRIHHAVGQGFLDGLPGPRALAHELPERLHVRPREPRGHRLDGLPLPVEEQAPDVQLSPVLAFGATHACHEFLQEVAEATLGGVERSRVHAANVHRSGRPVSTNLT